MIEFEVMKIWFLSRLLELRLDLSCTVRGEPDHIQGTLPTLIFLLPGRGEIIYHVNVHALLPLLGMVPRALGMLGKSYTTELQPYPYVNLLLYSDSKV